MKTIFRFTVLLALMAGVCFGQTIIQTQQGGTTNGTFKKYFVLNCVSGLTCSVSGSTLNMTGAGGGAPIDSPTFTGIPSAPTAALGTSTTQLATTQFVFQNSSLLGITSPLDTGAVNAYVVTLANPPAAYFTGWGACFLPANSSTSAGPTVNFNGLGVKTIVIAGGNGSAAAGSISTNNPACVIYNATSGFFTLIDPAGGTGSGVAAYQTNPSFLTAITTPILKTTTNCAAVGTAASPSVAACTAAPAGAFSCATAATGATCQVNTTAVTANSEIIVQQVVDEGTRLSVTCNTASVLPAGPLLASKSAGASFTINLGTVTTNPGCFDYQIIN